MVDSETGKTLPGLIHAVGQDGRPISIQRAAEPRDSDQDWLSRGQGMKHQPAIERWAVITGGVALVLPRETRGVKGFSGLETDLAHRTQKLTDRSATEVAIPLQRF